MRFPLLAKAATLGAVLLALLWGLSEVAGVVRERQMRQAEAQASLADSLAGAQAFAGPLLVRQCVETWQWESTEDKRRVTHTEHRDFRLLQAPASLDVQGRTAVEPRHRGLFSVNGFVLDATARAHWAELSRPEPYAEHGGRVHCEAPSLTMSVSDPRGIRSARILVDGVALPVSPDARAQGASKGFQAPLPVALLEGPGGFSTQVELQLVGTGSLTVAPIGDSTHVRIASDWPHPSFGGRFGPVRSRIADTGFDADWQVSTLATSAQRDWLEGKSLCAQAADGSCVEALSVSFFDPVNPYVLSDRATKYGLLFIVLTFVAVLLTEALRGVRVHPVQYLLVGCALTLFFLLLVSLGEHIPFDLAYAAAATSCTVLLGFYGVFALGGLRAGAAFGAGIAALYGAMYALLQREQDALVLGSVLLFAVLAVVMVVTRKLDWYALFGRLRAAAASPA